MRWQIEMRRKAEKDLNASLDGCLLDMNLRPYGVLMRDRNLNESTSNEFPDSREEQLLCADDVFYEDEMSPELKTALDEAIRDHKLGIGPRYSIEEVMERLYKKCVGELL